MRQRGLLTGRGNEAGAAVVESIFGIVLVMTLAVGAVQVALTLYGRNVMIAAAHEGARAGIEVGRDASTVTEVTTRSVTSSTGDLARDVDVAAVVTRTDAGVTVQVTVHAWLEPMGPIPVSIPVSAVATGYRGRIP